MARIPEWDYLLQSVTDFEVLTGMKVLLDDMPYDVSNTKKRLELEQKSSNYDAMTSWSHEERRIFTKIGWYTPLQKFINDPTMTSPDYDWEDTGKAGLAWATADNGDIWIIPWKLDLWAMFGRTSILKKHGLDMPVTLNELFDALPKVHDPPNIYGAAARGMKGQNGPFFSWLLHAYGVPFFDAEGKLATYGPKAVDAAIAYGNLMKYTPPGGIGFNWRDARMAFSAGQTVFMFEGYSGAPSYMEDPNASKISGDVTYGFLPGEKGPVYTSSLLGWLINPYSKKQAPAWYFLQWATSREFALESLISFGNVNLRDSIYKDPRYTTSKAFVPAWAEGVRKSLQEPSLPILPEINAVGEWQDVFGLIINEAVTNQDRDYLAKRLKEETERLQALEEKY